MAPPTACFASTRQPDPVCSRWHRSGGRRCARCGANLVLRVGSQRHPDHECENSIAEWRCVPGSLRSRWTVIVGHLGEADHLVWNPTHHPGLLPQRDGRGRQGELYPHPWISHRLQAGPTANVTPAAGTFDPVATYGTATFDDPMNGGNINDWVNPDHGICCPTPTTSRFRYGW